MTTSTYTNTADQTSDANFRAWIADLITHIVASGLVQTSDTGQINTATVTRPGATNTSAGYAIFRFNDTLQATAPIFIKVEFGTSNAVTNAGMWITVGTSTDGAGGITGTATTRQTAQFNVTFPTGSLASYICHASGSFTLAWRLNATTGVPMALFSVCRLCDATGATTNAGFLVSAINTAGSDLVASTARTTATNTVYGTYGLAGMGFIPGARANTNLQNGDTRAFPAFGYAPEMLPVVGLALVLATEFTLSNTFSVALISTTSHTYLCLRQAVSNASIGIAMIWE